MARSRKLSRVGGPRDSSVTMMFVDLLARISQHSPSKEKRHTCKLARANALWTGPAFDLLLLLLFLEKCGSREKLNRSTYGAYLRHILEIPSKCFRFVRTNVKYIYIYISPSLFLLSSSSPTFAIPLFFFLLHRKDDASTCKSSATIRCLNINPSTEVGSFQFRSRDRSWNITSDLKLDSSQTFTTVFLPLLSSPPSPGEFFREWIGGRKNLERSKSAIPFREKEGNRMERVLPWKGNREEIVEARSKGVSRIEIFNFQFEKFLQLSPKLC